ncbi:hypothetical protein JOL79_08790 [Microbispora sp. RL4-1S]|uniref:Uncharacterized protein n=1 Tax=Microbispora oryzae TaxID=2806554 RepID=A0A941AII6_9ACTN|nr:hypothetical protein [Microbispora oryzae]MBP2703902.1 hypothetical protein [Microbispora oryzae]
MKGWFSSVAGLVLLSVSLLVSGCGILPRTAEVDPGIVSDMRGIGKVLAETKTKSTWRGLTTVSQVAIVDVGGTNTGDALHRATELLRERGWVVVAQGRSDWVVMTSREWGEARLAANSLEFIESTGDLDPAEQKAILQARKSAGSNAPVVLEANPADP